MKTLATAVGAATILAITPAMAVDAWKEKQRDQLLYQEQQKMQEGQAQPDQQGAIGATKPTSGPGVQGPPDTRTGPATKAPDGSASMDSSGSASTGASTGETGASSDASGSAKTQPSQDSSGVQGFPDTRTGPATKNPDELDQKDKAGSQ